MSDGPYRPNAVFQTQVSPPVTEIDSGRNRYRVIFASISGVLLLAAVIAVSFGFRVAFDRTSRWTVHAEVFISIGTGLGTLAILGLAFSGVMLVMKMLKS